MFLLYKDETEKNDENDFLKFFKRTSVLFVGPLIPLLWTSGDVCLGFQSQGESPCLHALSCLQPHLGLH